MNRGYFSRVAALKSLFFNYENDSYYVAFILLR